jgi:sugar phosphate isomerase/epimerase
MLGPDDLVLCAGTLLETTLVERIAAARAAGFSAVSIWAEDFHAARAAGLSDADLRAILDDHGIAVAEVDGLTGWVPSSDDGSALFGGGEEELYEIADALGARSINAIHLLADPVDAAAGAEAFAGVCDRAREHGLLVHLEFLPWSGIPNAARAAEIVALADRPNGGLMIDTWHHIRSGAGDGALRALAGARVLAVQLSDAPDRAEADVIDETMHRRRLPGQGDGNLAELVRLLDATGSSAPIGVEVFSDELRALPANEAARRAARAARDVIARARRSA